MTKTFLFWMALTLFSNFSASAQTSSVEGKRVQQTVTNMLQQFADLDVDKLKSYCTTDFKILEHGVIWNADSVARVLVKRKGTDFKRINTLIFLDTRVQGNTAWTTYSHQADITINGRATKRHWLESAVLVKDGKGWKINLLHSTRVN